MIGENECERQKNVEGKTRLIPAKKTPDQAVACVR